jgi:ABC-type transport system substrate-binding protein
MSEGKKVDRRKFLVAGLGAGIVVVGGVAAYLASRPPQVVEKVVEKTVPVERTVEKVVERTVQTTIAGTPTVITRQETVRETVVVTPEEQPGYGGELKVATFGAINTADPHNAPSHQDLVITLAGYDTLFRFDENFNVIPWLAERYEVSSDGLEYTFYIRKGVYWQVIDRELTAEDVAYSLNRIQQSTIAKAYFPIWGEAVAVDRYTVKVRLPKRFVPLINDLANPGSRGSMIVPKLSEEDFKKLGMTSKEFEEKGGFATIMIGTGPFRLVDFKRGEYERFEKHKKYWRRDEKGRQLPYLDKLEFIPQPDASVRAMQLRAGSVDIATMVDPKDVPTLEATKGIKVMGMIGTYFGQLGMCWQHPPFNDKRVRQAVAHAINRDEIVRLALSGGGEPAWSPLPSWNKYHKEFRIYEYNPKRAKELLEEAGVKEITGTLYGYSSYPAPETLTVVQKQLAAVNINLEINIVDLGTYVAELKNRDPKKHTITIHIWVDKIDPWISLCQRFYPPTGSAFIEGIIPDVEGTGLARVRDALAEELNPEKYAKLVEELQRIWVEEVISVPLWFKANYWAFNEKVRNFSSEPLTYTYSWDVMWKAL